MTFLGLFVCCFFLKQKTAYEMRISDWSSDVCSSDLSVSAGAHVPIWVLGSTVNGASIAGQLGLPFSIASHFAPDQIDDAIRVYREAFTADAPTAQIDRKSVV